MTHQELTSGDRVRTRGFQGMDAITAMKCEQGGSVEMQVVAVGPIRVRVRSESGRTFLVDPSDLDPI